MTQRVTIDAQGGLAIPSDVLQAAGLKPGAELALDFVEGQVVVYDPKRPEIEVYTEERIAEFASDEAAARPAIEAYLARNANQTSGS